MSFSINTNITSLEAQNYLNKSSQFQAHTINEVTSGLRIVNSGDDAAGLAIANGFRSDEAVLNQGIQNANNGLATLQTIDGGMNNISTLLDRARTLATESASGTFSGNRNTLNQEFQSVIAEVTRQATAIGMNQGGQFAQALSVFIGGGKGITASTAASNGTIAMDLSKSAVDAQGLGLQGVQAAGQAGTDIGSGSAATSVAAILANTANTASEATSGYTKFSFSGPGFGDGSKVSVSVNLGGVTDTTTLAAAINSAIASAGNGTTQASTAFKNANVSASVVTDSTGKEQLAFSSSNTAFQVQAGDKTANALLGNFSQNASLQGSDSSAALSANGLNFSSIQIDGKAVTLSNATTTALAGGAVATASSISGLATASDAAIAAASLAGKTLTLTVDGGSAATITLQGGETTLAQIANEISSSGTGVTASVSGSSTTQTLTLTSNTTGSNSNVTVTGGTVTSMAGAATITGFTGSATGINGTNGAVAKSTSGKVSSTATINNATIAALNGNAGTTAGDTIALNVNGVAKSITLTTGDSTLASIAADITNSSAGVTATVTGSGATQKLTLTSNATGSSSNVSFLATGTTAELKVAGVLGFTADTAGTAGLDATPPPTKGSIIKALNSDANFSSVATASLNGNQVIIQSNTNNPGSSVQLAGSLATALGFSTTAATAAGASTGAALKTTVQSAGALGNINQAVIGSLSAPAATVANGNHSLNISLNGGTAVNLTLTNGSTTNAQVAADINTQIAASSLAGQVTASVDSNGKLDLAATAAGTTVTVGGSGATADTAAVNLGFTVGQTSGTATNALFTSSDNIKVQFTGAGMTSPVTLNLAATTTGTTKVSDVVADLTSQIANNSALAAAGISLTTSTQGNNLVFTDNKGEKFQVAVTGDTHNVLGFGSFNAGSGGSFDYSTLTGTTTLPTAPQANTASTGSLNISLNGTATQSAINVSLKSTSGTVTGSATTDAAVSAAGLASSDKIGFLVNGVQKTVTFAGGETTLASLASEINTAAQGVTADIVGTGSHQSLRLTATGTGSSVAVTAAVSTSAGLAATGLVAGQTGTGLASAAAVQADAANQINAAIAGNSALSGAGIQASIVSNKLVLTSSNGSNFRVSGSGATDLGFGIAGGSYAGTTNSAAPTVGRVDSSGAYTSSSMAFTAIANGADSQGVTITATDSNGNSHSQAITLQNNATARTGDNIDDAIHAINTQLQQSNDSTLQSIYAVKENNPDGTESIKFQSTTSNFKVAVSSLADGSGITAPTGGVSTATQNGSGANAAIDTIAGAETAVNALASAVQTLGTAQAAVGKSENNLNYAVSLAQSQSTNEAAAESQIRDANLAQEAANLTKAQILVQAGTAALSQANSAPQQLLSLLQGH